MDKTLKILGNEQTFITPNTFSNTTSNIIAGYNVVRIINTSTSVVGIITITNAASSAQIGNISILPLSEVLIKKQSNNTLTASATSLLGCSVAFNQ